MGQRIVKTPNVTKQDPKEPSHPCYGLLSLHLDHYHPLIKAHSHSFLIFIPAELCYFSVAQARSPGQDVGPGVGTAG